MGQVPLPFNHVIKQQGEFKILTGIEKHTIHLSAEPSEHGLNLLMHLVHETNAGEQAPTETVSQ